MAIDKVRDVVENASSLEEARDQIIELYGDSDPNQLAEIMQRALMAAELGGRAQVLDDGEG